METDSFWRPLGDALRAAAPSAKLDAFEVACQRAAALISAEFPRAAAVDRLQALAEVHGLFDQHGVDHVQKVMARGFDAPLLDQDTDEARPPAFSDEALALNYAEQHCPQLRYVAGWGKWQIWNGVRWHADETLHAFDMVRKACRAAAQVCNKDKISKAIASAKTVAAVERLARSDRRLAATSEQWDTDPWLFNTPGGIVDLRNGQISGHVQSQYMTKVAGVTPDFDAPTPAWCNFLERTTGHDKELSGFLQRVSGYALTGLTSEHALFFIYGTGANGKSTFLNALIGCCGDYHRTSAIETFTASATERHPTDLAALRGARLVTAVETEEGRRWAESKIKSLTGGDRIAARFMRQDFFEFTPAFKLLIAGNHKPGLRSVDEAIRRRFHLIPFTTTVPKEERDETLAEKLQQEWSGILAWAIRGCLDWQTIGLAAPECVRAATAAYLEAEDALAAWIDDECQFDQNAWESTSALYYAWKRYADRSGEYAGSLKKFRQKLEDRSAALGLQAGRASDGQRGFYGIRIIKEPDHHPATAFDDGDANGAVS
jgi:putative DNA primase/helicase